MKAIGDKKRPGQQSELVKVIIAQDLLKRLSKRGPKRLKVQKGC
jgi:hypothetical protein